PGLPVDRLRALHPRRGPRRAGARRPLVVGGRRQEGMRAALAGGCDALARSPPPHPIHTCLHVSLLPSSAWRPRRENKMIPSILERRSDLGRLVALLALASVYPSVASAQTTLLNVSYDPTRELYRDINALFIADWKQKSGEAVAIRMSHGGSGAQARAVIARLDASGVTLALPADIDAIAAQTRKIPPDWQRRLPAHSSPHTTTTLVVVPQGN